LNDASLRPDLMLLEPGGEKPFQATLASPLHVAGELFGVVTVDSRQKQEWTAEQFRLVEWLAAQCCHILETLRLQESQSRLAAIVESSDDAILSKDLNGTIQTWNAGAERLFGYRAQEVIGRSIALLMPPDRLTEEDEILDQLRAGKRVDHRETVRVAKDGRYVDVLVTASSLKDRDGQIIGASKIARDISERKRAEEALRKSTEDLSRSNKDLEQFAYVASHDLQEPLRAVAGFVELLRRNLGSSLNSKAAGYMDFAVDGAKRMQLLINGLLEYSRVGQDEKHEETSARAALDRAVAYQKNAIEEFSAEIEADELPAVHFDLTQLTQLFQNLIGNAIKFRGKEAPRVHIGAKRDSDGWQFSVSDNGIGIEPEYTERIFLIFQRLHSRENYPGTGIGLAICKKIVERHKGKIWVESKLGEGSTFYFTIPDSSAGGLAMRGGSRPVEE
jgi:PAS domain S-box-containing protein